MPLVREIAGDSLDRLERSAMDGVRVPEGVPVALAQLLTGLEGPQDAGPLKDALGLSVRLFAGVATATCLEFDCLPPRVAELRRRSFSVGTAALTLTECLRALASRPEPLAQTLCAVFLEGGAPRSFTRQLGLGTAEPAVTAFCAQEAPSDAPIWREALQQWVEASVPFWAGAEVTADPGPLGHPEVCVRLGEHLLRTGVVPRQRESAVGPALAVVIPPSCPRNLAALLHELALGQADLKDVLLYLARFFAAASGAAGRELGLPSLIRLGTLGEAIGSLRLQLEALEVSQDPLAVSLRQVFMGPLGPHPFAVSLGLQGTPSAEVRDLVAGREYGVETVKGLLEQWLRKARPFFLQSDDQYEATGQLGQMELCLRHRGRRLATGLYVRLAEYRRLTAARANLPLAAPAPEWTAATTPPPAPVVYAPPRKTTAEAPVDKPAATWEPPKPTRKYALPRFPTLRLTHRDRAVFLRSLGLMLNSGVTIVRALEILARQGDSPRLAQASGHMAAMLVQGHNLYQAMAGQPGLFEPYQLKLIQVGCATGRLAAVLERQSEHEERRHATGMRVRASLVQPAFVFGGTLLMVILLPLVLFRGLLELVQNAGLTLPWSTQVVLFFSDLIRSPWFLLAAGLGGAALVHTVVRGLRSPSTRKRVAHFLLAVPGLGTSLRVLAVYRFASALELLVCAGASIAPSMHLAGEASGNPILEEQINGAVAKLLDGEELTASLESTGFFPPMFLQAVQVGTEFGDLSRALRQNAHLLELELEYRLQMVEQMLEPLVMVIMGIVVGFTVVATMLPLLQVAESL